ncbi:TonB-dependent receptor domain-containing protein [Pseudobacteriovorax antillogorgiicola]|uniref:Iron complex outermembrane recepter protein n=1 Tax=Pseudobacteriovorax antillogorgiicola TaxID=1513793 RepID=A0A1Y6BHM0_9BACT|nr:TonB-dependent receptor [Pseudobacteriovorax antillogorgiicola]TCS57264.1 iron complex outermembrane receptor protein [Pseudobacteriovorax antillogorgiicola]SMF03268.1 iron complex outermembrane recepter protein [Pseudobacteriovorax antillogorgiicola]
MKIIPRHSMLGYGILLGILAMPALGQETNQENKKPERMKVVGSHIKRIDSEGASPVISISRDDISSSGANTVSQLLKNYTGSSFGARSSTSGNAAAGAETVSLKGLGATRTLVLLNGRRLLKDPLLQAPDLSLIPTTAVERVEILNEGASALYGSDAVGGVVNIITRKDFSGSEFFARKSWTKEEGGGKATAGWIGGSADENSNYVGVVSYTEEESIRSSNRVGEAGLTSSTGNPGTYYDANDNSYAFPDCPAADLVTNSDGTSQCRFDYTKYSDVKPEVKRLSGMFNYQYDITPDVSLFTSFGVSQARTRDQFAPSPSRGLVISAEAADELGLSDLLPEIEPGEQVKFDYRFLELGPRKFRQEINTIQLATGFEGVLLNNYDWMVGVSQARTSRLNMTTEGIAVKDKVVDAINTGAYNPFDPSSSELNNLDSFSYKPFSQQISQQRQVDARISGEIMELGAGPWAFAIGGSFALDEYHVKYDDLTLRSNVTSGIAGEGDGSRDVKSMFLEFGLLPIEDLEVQIAARYDEYSDFGDTLNPKLSLGYSIADSLLLRTSYGTGFKAPDLDQLYDGPSNGFPRFFDPVACEANPDNANDCKAQQHETVQGGNRDLKEETFVSFNIGLIYQPTADFNLSLDYNDIVLEDVISRDTDSALSGILDAVERGIDVEQYGVKIERDGNSRIVLMTAPNLNLARREVKTVTLQAGYRLNLGIGRLKFDTMHSHILSYKEEPFPGLGVEELRGLDDRPIYRNNTTFTYQSIDRNHGVQLLARTIGDYKGVEVQGERAKMPAHVEWDVNYTWTTPIDSTVELGAINVLQKRYPIDPEAGGVDIDIYNITGTSYYLGYSQRI